MVRLAFSFPIVTIAHEEPTATSNAPSIGRKRRMNDEDADEQEAGSTRKRRGQLERQDTSELGELGAKEAKEREVDPAVKQVTRGVKEVQLEDKEAGSGTDDGKGVSEEAAKTVDGEPSVAAPLEPAHATKKDDSPSQDVTATDDEVPAGQSEATAEPPSDDPPSAEAPTSTDIREPPAQDEEKEPLDTPGTRSDEVTDARESVESSPEP
jgi:hypothetical protein